MRLLLLISILISTLKVSAQSDSTAVLLFDDYYRLVLNNHPVVKQAELLPENAVQQLRLARGGFDPKLKFSWDFKEFKDTEYYNIADVSLDIPIWFPIDTKVGFERNQGEFLNPENFISDETRNQQIYAGFTIPLGQGLFVDQRRATVKQARLMQDMAEAEQIKEINKILLTAAKDYWNWYYAYNNYILMQQNITIAQDIFDRTTLGFEYGEAAAIDTVQALITLQTRKVAFEQANLERIRSALKLSNHLWTEDGVPLEIGNNVAPQDPLQQAFDVSLLGSLVEQARDNHPELVKLGIKEQSLLVDKSMARENIKPRLDFSYFLLDQPLEPTGEGNGFALNDNFKMGVNFEFPLFIRKERSKIQQIDIKLRDNQYQQGFRERVILNDINANYNAILATANILQQQQDMVDSYQLIVAAERINLDNGESDLFKINVQFEKLISAQTKLFKLRADYQKRIVNLYWAAGVSNLGLQ